MKITLQTLTGKEVVLEVEQTDSVERVKEYMEETEGILPSQQRLIYDGKQLNDESTLEECGISDGALLHLVLTLRGGF